MLFFVKYRRSLADQIAEYLFFSKENIRYLKKLKYC